MRRRDKLKNIVRANLLAEQRYLKSKGLLNETPWNGDPNSNWVPDDDRLEVEVYDWNLDFGTSEDIDKYPDDHILVNINAATGSQGWNTSIEISGIIPHKEREKYAPLVQQLINLNGGKDYKVSDEQLSKNPKTKEIADILDGLISGYAEDYDDIDWDDPHWRDEDLMPGGKEWKLDRGLDEDSLSEGRTTRADIVVFSHLSDIPLDKANVRKRAEFIKFIIDKCDGDLNKDIDPEALWSEFSEGVFK